jgi:hypothetical protein
MHPVILEALARAKTDELIRSREQRALRASLAVRPKRPSQPVEDHKYQLPDVVEVPRVVSSETHDESVW